MTATEKETETPVLQEPLTLKGFSVSPGVRWSGKAGWPVRPTESLTLQHWDPEGTHCARISSMAAQN